MNSLNPPRWLESLLLSLLSPRNRETVSGDLLEEYRERSVRNDGPFRAGLWYAVQVVSFVPQRVASAIAERPVLALFCLFTATSGAWLGAIDFAWKRPGYVGREAIAATIVCQALLTLAALCLPRSVILRPVTLAGTLAILWLAGKALWGLLHGYRLEGYVLLIALALVVQAVLTWLACLHPGRTQKT